MSFYLADATGYLDDVASIGGWMALRAWAATRHGADELDRFLRTGVSYRPSKLADDLAQGDHAGETVEAVRIKMLACASRAQTLLILSDGTGVVRKSLSNEKFDANQPRDDHGRWSHGGDSLSSAAEMVQYLRVVTGAERNEVHVDPQINTVHAAEATASVLQTVVSQDWWPGGLPWPTLTTDQWEDALGASHNLKYTETQPRVPSGSPEGGRFASGGGDIDALLARVAQPDGGFTYNAVTGQEPTTGFAVSIYKGGERSYDPAKLTIMDLAKFAKENWAELKEPGRFFGAWHDPVGKKVYLDVSRVVPDLNVALDLAKRHQQLAVFDLQGGVSIPLNEQHPRGGGLPEPQRDKQNYTGDDHAGHLTEAYLAHLRATDGGRSVAAGHRGAVHPSDGQDPDGGGSRGGAEDPVLKVTQDDVRFRAIVKAAETRQEPALSRGLLSAWKAAQRVVRLDVLRRGIAASDWEQLAAALAGTKIEVRVREVVQPMLASAYLRGVDHAAPTLARLGVTLHGIKAVRPMGGLHVRQLHQYASTWARLRAGELVIAEPDVQALIRDFVTMAVTDGFTVDETAELIRGIIGLDPPRARALQRRGSDLRALGLSGDALQKAIDKYAGQLLDARAETIARTEIMMATNAGQQGLWNEAIDRGLILRSQMRKVWIVTEDAACCDLCEQLGLSEPVPVTGMFAGGVQFPPRHPRCRCAVGLVPNEG